MYTQNNNGIFFNLSWVSEETMSKIEQFIEFCDKSTKELIKYETLCDVLNHKLYEKEECIDHKLNTITKTKHKTNKELTDEAEIEKKNIVSAKISSSMKFYLLKKKFAKPITLTANYENDLMAEEYIL
jgi:hypothetical protein